MLIFLDTEFSNFRNPQLLSVGLVSEAGDELYLEVSDYDERRCTDFVCEHVLPLMDGVHLPLDEVMVQLRAWFEELLTREHELVLVTDYTGDYYLIERAVAGLPITVRLLDSLLCDQVLPDNRHITSDVVEDLTNTYFETLGRGSRHHALVDAKSNLYAYKEALVLLGKPV